LTSDNPAAGYGYFDLMAYNPAEGSGNGIVRAIATLAVSIQHYLWDLQVGLISGMQMLLRPSEAGTVMEIDNYGGSSGASGINGAKLTSDQKKKAAYAVEYLKQKGGWTTNQAVGIVSNLMRESGMNERAVGDHGTSFGLPQLHGSRVNDFRQWSGHDIRNSTLDEQLGFINHELTVGKERRAGDIIRGTQTSDQAARAGTQYYERPRDIAGESNKSAAIARLLGARIDPMAETGASTHMSLRDWSDSVAKRGGTVSSDVRIGTIVIHTAATDARGIAAEIYPAITRTANAYRSDTGLA
jgi:hypothetical protein